MLIEVEPPASMLAAAAPIAVRTPLVDVMVMPSTLTAPNEAEGEPDVSGICAKVTTPLFVIVAPPLIEAIAGAAPVTPSNSCPFVPAVIAVGVAPAPPPITTPYCPSAADEAKVPEAVKPSMPPLVPDERPVPPRDKAS